MTQHPARSPLVSPAAPAHGGPASVERQLERQLPSGRALVLRTDPAGEEIEIRSPRGEVEVKIVLTDAGPVVTLRGGRLELDAPAVAVRCQSFAVQAEQDVHLAAQGGVHIAGEELRARTAQDIHLNGAYIRLNCTPETPNQPAPGEPAKP